MQPDDHLSRRAFLAASAAAASGLPALAAATRPAGKPAKSGGKPNWQIGCYTRPWAAFEYTVALDSIAEAGFRYVGLMTTKTGNHLVLSTATSLDEAGRIGEEIRKRKLRVLSVYGGDIGVDQGLKAGIDGMRKLIDNCAAVRSATLLMGGIGNQKLFDDYYKAIAECCDYAAEKKLQITVKPHGGTNSTGPECRRIIEKVNHKNFRLWYDPGNIFFYSDGKLNPVDDAATVDGIVSGMCVKDFLPPKNVDVTPGTGKVDFAAVLGRLKKGGLTGGPLVIETLAPGGEPQAIVEQARKALAFLQATVANL
jgi:sugar phosphate isomerase/epimerase